jgi:hypothetical protein
MRLHPAAYALVVLFCPSRPCRKRTAKREERLRGDWRFSVRNGADRGFRQASGSGRQCCAGGFGRRRLPSGRSRRPRLRTSDQGARVGVADYQSIALFMRENGLLQEAYVLTAR